MASPWRGSPQQTGLTKSYLSKIERGQSTPSIAVALKVARALDVDVGRLFSDEAAEEKIAVDRATARAADDTGCWRRRCSESPCRRSWFARQVYPADDPHPEHAGQEFVFVHAGTVELDYGDQTITARTGDSAYFDASVSHRFRSIGKAAAEVVVVADNDPNGYRR